MHFSQLLTCYTLWHCQSTHLALHLQILPSWPSCQLLDFACPPGLIPGYGPCCCSINPTLFSASLFDILSLAFLHHFFHHDHQHSHHHQTTHRCVWVIYCDCMTLHFKSQYWVSHLTSTNIPQAYIIKGDINGSTPDEWWAWKEEEAMDMIGLPIPDDVFMAIKITPLLWMPGMSWKSLLEPLSFDQSRSQEEATQLQTWRWERCSCLFQLSQLFTRTAHVYRGNLHWHWIRSDPTLLHFRSLWLCSRWSQCSCSHLCCCHHIIPSHPPHLWWIWSSHHKEGQQQ